MSEYLKKFELDYKFGTDEEDILLDIFKINFNKKIKKSKIKNSWYDYYCDNVYYEMKSRKNKFDKYPTTMIGLNKINRAKNQPHLKGLVFIFNFTDKIGYIEYNEEKFNTYELKTGGRFDRGRIETNLYYYIPISDLTILD